MPSKYPSKNQLKQLALERIKILFSEAKKNPSKANRYVELARKIAMKVNLKIPKEYKRRYCKHCSTYFKTGNYRVRTKEGYVISTCFTCKKYSKYKI